MAKYINADDLKVDLNWSTVICKDAQKLLHNSNDPLQSKYAGIAEGYERIQASIDAMPPADVVEVKHAHWVATDGDDPGYESGHSAWIEFECSCCKYDMTLETGEYGWGYDEDNKIPFDYCPNCGARMDGEME